MRDHMTYFLYFCIGFLVTNENAFLFLGFGNSKKNRRELHFFSLAKRVIVLKTRSPNNMLIQQVNIDVCGIVHGISLSHLTVVESVCVPPDLTFRPGVWLFANSLPWYKDAKESLARMLPRLKLDTSQLIIGVPTAVAKAPPLQISHIPARVWSLSFIHISALVAVISSCKFRTYFMNQDINPMTVATTILSFYQNMFQGRRIVLPMPSPTSFSTRVRTPPYPISSSSADFRTPNKRGRPRINLEDLTNTAYACRVARQRIVDPVCRELLGVRSGDTLSRSDRRKALTVLLQHDALSRSAAVAAVAEDHTLGRQVLQANGALADSIALGLAVPLWVSLLMKDTVMLSDTKMRNISSSHSSTAVTDYIQLSRAHDVMIMRRLTNTFVIAKFGIADFVNEECIRAVCNLPSVCKMHVYAAMSRGYTELRPDTLLRWKLTFDGTDAGGKSILVFGIIPLSLGVRSQSNASVFPLAISWASESSTSLVNTVPGLTECIADLHTHGLAIQLPEGVCHLPVRIDVAADMSSLWKLNGIGSASKSKSCIYCSASSESRQHVGDTICNLHDPANFRTDLLPIFGLTLDRIHICTLHGLTRVTEKIVKLVAVHCVALEKRHAIAVDEAKTSVRNAEQAVRLAELVNVGGRGGGRGRGRGRVSRQQEGAPSVQGAKLALAHANAVYTAIVAVSAQHGSTSKMAEAIVATGVLQKTFNIAVEHHKRGDGATVAISSFTGTQAQKLLGCYSKPDETPPYVTVVHAAYGACLHPNANTTEDGLLDARFCIVCNVLFLFRTFGSQLLPVVQAVSVSDLTTAFQKAFPGKTEFCEETFHRRFQHWGAVLVHTFYGGGSRSVISDYCTFCVLGVKSRVVLCSPRHNM